MQEHNLWWQIPAWHIIIGCSPKCGTSTLYAAVAKAGVRCHAPTLGIGVGQRIWIVREPVERFWSLWKDKCLKGEILYVGEKRARLAGMTPEELIDYIETTNKKDAHWDTQSEHEGGTAQVLVPLERFSDWWEEQGYPGPLKTVNRTEKLPMDLSDDLVERIKIHYADDVRLYKQARR